MATPPDLVRRALLVVTAAAQDEIRSVSQAAVNDPEEWRALLFAAAPLIVAEYGPAASTLALDWFEEIRAEANPGIGYTPIPQLLVTDEDVAAMVARVTEDLQTLEQRIADEAEQLMAEVTEALAAEVQKDVAAGFWDTMTHNAAQDPASRGWQRFSRDAGCKFCLMLAGRGAVYTKSSVRFAAHTNCHCVVGPSYDPDAPQADVMQCVASKRTRTEKERAELRAYLTENFPDAPG